MLISLFTQAVRHTKHKHWFRPWLERISFRPELSVTRGYLRWGSGPRSGSLHDDQPLPLTIAVNPVTINEGPDRPVHLHPCPLQCAVFVGDYHPRKRRNAVQHCVDGLDVWVDCSASLSGTHHHYSRVTLGCNHMNELCTASLQLVEVVLVVPWLSIIAAHPQSHCLEPIQIELLDYWDELMHTRSRTAELRDGWVNRQ